MNDKEFKIALYLNLLVIIGLLLVFIHFDTEIENINQKIDTEEAVYCVPLTPPTPPPNYYPGPAPTNRPPVYMEQ